MIDEAHIDAPLQIGQLAKATGVTVRTLHHYDAIGLLVPDERTQSGRRLYSDRNVRRLYQIVALRQLGLPLEEIAAVLRRRPDLEEAVRRHLARVDEALSHQLRLKRTLARILERFEQEREPSLDEFVQAIQEVTMSERYYTPEQQQQLADTRDELGDQGIRDAEAEWAELIEAVKAERAAGTAPTDPRVLALARRWRGLIEQFTGGDEGIRGSLEAMYREEGAETASRGMVDAALMGYVGEALRALDGS